MKIDIQIEQGVKSEVELAAKLNKVMIEHFSSDVQIHTETKTGETIWVVREN